MLKKKTLKLNKVTLQNLDCLSQKESLDIKGGKITLTIFRTICAFTCVTDC